MSDRDDGRIRDAGYDEWLDALEAGEPYYLACPDGHGSLPPRRVCPECGATDLTETALPTTGTIETLTVTHVPTPSFQDDAPYATAIADFGSVRLTGKVVGDEPTAIETDTTVEATVTDSETTGDRVVSLRPR